MEEEINSLSQRQNDELTEAKKAVDFFVRKTKFYILISKLGESSQIIGTLTNNTLVENTALLEMRNQTIKILSFKKRKNLFHTGKQNGILHLPKS
jgi:hypothetical protein